MDERLKKLRSAMMKTTFSQLSFTDKLSSTIRERISKETEKEEDILLAVLQLLVQEKTGYELVKSLRSRGFKKYEDHEGLLYALLHRLEQKGTLNSTWRDDETKVYCLSDKGRKVLQKAEKTQGKRQLVLTELLER